MRPTLSGPLWLLLEALLNLAVVSDDAPTHPCNSGKRRQMSQCSQRRRCIRRRHAGSTRIHGKRGLASFAIRLHRKHAGSLADYTTSVPAATSISKAWIASTLFSRDKRPPAAIAAFFDIEVSLEGFARRVLIDSANAVESP